MDYTSIFERARNKAIAENSDITLLEHAYSKAPLDEHEFFFDCVRRAAINNNSIAVLSHLIARGMSVKSLSPRDFVGYRNTSKATLEFLLVHGWDINTRCRHDSTIHVAFFWDYDMIVWCLEHGAKVHTRDHDPLRDDVLTLDQRHCEQILEEVAAWGTVATFKLLRSKGAPLGWRPLHRAVETATYGHAKRNWIDHEERMAMVRHILHVEGFDVNARDRPQGSSFGGRNGTPICYLTSSGMLERDTRELTWLLLDRGADPTPALSYAKTEYPKFVEDVEAWRKLPRVDRRCCVQ
ncbi:hypothetical protein K458DRAFT_478242 [Lentithecium fluviatile CBS 122367]|uniref:Ankyrin n=1 Tax=Lentithecium fluviatile CBS 122367 TaxID=1168545 RepID=A0A6G1IZC5_9PLEO|nr:hypothetical protein K458DRAFT_478242 [Lentithecium fluviatile CBS 122367]